MRKKLPFQFSFFLFFFLSIPGAVFSQTKTLDWDIQFFKENSGESLPINRTISMETGERFSLVITPHSDCYCYVFVYTSVQEIYVWYNQDAGKDTPIPLKPLRLTDPSGTETVYVIVSSSRQGELERLISLFKNNSSRQNTDNLYSEIARLQDAASSQGGPAVPIITNGSTSREAGPVNSSSGDDKIITAKFSGKDLYVRAIGVRH
ncbi:MAG: DUF4384 domain-containing protein [Treponema sp.]|nr:DUF4384 domain-containing protein [Treponema sp.]